MGGCCAPTPAFFWGGGLSPNEHNVAWTEAYLYTKWHPNPSNRLAAIQQRHRQTGQTGQRSSSIGRTVLQTAVQKERPLHAVVEMIQHYIIYQRRYGLVACSFQHASVRKTASSCPYCRDYDQSKMLLTRIMHRMRYQ